LLGRHRGQRPEQQSRLTDTRISADQYNRSRNESTTEHAIEFGEPSRNPRDLIRNDRIQRREFGLARGLEACSATGGLPRLGQGVPAAAIGALTLPLAVLGSTLTTGKNSLQLSHMPAA
jgi:hypothetical protein